MANSSTQLTKAEEIVVGTEVTYQGTLDGMIRPLGRVNRPRRFNSLINAYTYGVIFPKGYYQVEEQLLTVSSNETPSE